MLLLQSTLRRSGTASAVANAGSAAKSFNARSFCGAQAGSTCSRSNRAIASALAFPVRSMCSSRRLRRRSSMPATRSCAIPAPATGLPDAADAAGGGATSATGGAMGAASAGSSPRLTRKVAAATARITAPATMIGSLLEFAMGYLMWIACMGAGAR
jgi:hypothetical protein